MQTWTILKNMIQKRKYRLLPFRFNRIKGREVVVSEVGDFLIVPFGTVSQILDGSISKETDLYKDLLAKYIICEDYNKYLQDVLATRLRTKKSFMDHFTALHIFVMTLRCNQKCIYCQALSQEKSCTHKDMSIDDLDCAIRLMLQSPNPNITMEFQGGESSLVPKLIEHAVTETIRRNEAIGKDIKFVICTNLYKFDDELLDLCNRYNIFISSSLDGPEFLHDHNRGHQGSYEHFCSNLKKARAVLGQNRISPLMTTSEMSLAYPHEIIDSYRNLGFHRIFLRPLNPYGRATEHNWEDYNERFLVFYKEALEYIIQLNRKGIFFAEDFTTMLMKKILTPFPIGFVDLQSPAGIINNVIVYNYDGYVYCSDESRMMAEAGDYTFRLGKVSDEYSTLFYGKKAQMLSKIWATEFIAGCSDCAYQQYCGADPVRNYSTQGDWYGHRPTGLFCIFHKAVFDHLFTLIDERGEEVLPIFRTWVYGN